MSSANLPPRFKALTRPFLDRIAAGQKASNQVVTCDEFATDYRTYAEGSIECWWAKMTHGATVPAEISEAYALYLIDKMGWTDVEPESVCVDGPASLAPRPERVWWGKTWLNRAKSALIRTRLRASGVMYINPSEAETLIPLAARMILRCVGRLTWQAGEPIDEEALIAAGARQMHTSLAGYTAVLRGWYRFDPHCVMFARCKDKGRGGKDRTAAATVILPLTERGMASLMTGTLYDLDVSEDHLQPASPHLYVHACGVDHALAAELGGTRSEDAQMYCLLTQAAYLSRALADEAPYVVVPVTNPLYEARLREQGYRDLNARMKTTGVPLMIFDGQIKSANSRYVQFTDLLRRYRAVNGWSDGAL